MTVMAMPKILRERLTDEGVEALGAILNKVEEDTQRATLQISEEKFERRLAEVRSDLIKWMFIFIFGQYWLIVGTITGILFAFFRR